MLKAIHNKYWKPSNSTFTVKHFFMKKIITILVLITVYTTSFAQKTQRVVADKIIAQVGDKIILHSDIINAIADYKRQGQEAQLPPNPECAFLEGQLIQKALVLQAEKDSLTVSDEEIEAALDNQIRGFIQMYGSKEVVEEVSGKSIFQLKEDFKQIFKERKLSDQMRAKIVDNVKITPVEAKALWEKIPKDSLVFYETELEIKELVMYPKANKDVEEYVGKQLLELKRQVEAGNKKFEQLAKLYTEDPGSKESGGQYTVNRADKNVWDPTFLAACFKLKEGQISNLVKTKFGLHIIQMVSRAGDEAVIRHILKIPPISEDEINIVKAKIDSVRNVIVTGKMIFSEAVNKNSEDEGSKFSGGAKTSKDGSSYVTYDELDKDLVPVLKGMKVGDISKPVVFTDERGKKAVRIVYLRNRTDPHIENFKDDYNKIAQRALDQKKQSTLEKWFKTHIPNYYITIDHNFGNCEGLDEWKKAAQKSAAAAK